MEDYISAYDALSVHTNKVDIDLECMPESFSAMSPIYGLIAQRACQGLTVEKARTGLLAQTILAQHAIKHEVLTLQSARYNKLAHQPVF